MIKTTYISTWVTRNSKVSILVQAIEALSVSAGILDPGLDTSDASLASSVGEQGHGTFIPCPLLAQGVGDVVTDASRLVREFGPGSDELGCRCCRRDVHHDAGVGTGLDTTTWRKYSY